MSKTTIQATARTFLPRLKIHPDPDQPRKTFDEAKLAELRISFGDDPGGIHTDLLVRAHPKKADEFMLVAGERRWRAAGLEIKADGLGLKPFAEVPCRILSAEEAAKARQLQLTENMQRENMTALEEAAGAQRLLEEERAKDPKFSIEQLGQRLGKKRAATYELLSLLKLSKPVHAALVAGEINPSMAARIAAVPLPEVQQDILMWLNQQTGYGQVISVRDLQNYILGNHCKPLEDAPFSLMLTYEGKRIVAFSCIDCPHRSGNQPNWPDGKDANTCLRPECYQAKALAHAIAEGKEAIKPQLFDANRDDYVLPDQRLHVHSKGYVEAKKVINPKAPPRTFVTTDSRGDLIELWLRKEWQASAESDGVQVVPPPAPPKARVNKEPKKEMTEQEKEEFFEQQRREEKQREKERKEEEKRQREREENAAKEQIRCDVVEAIKPQLRAKLEKVPEQIVLLFVLDALQDELFDVLVERKIKAINKCGAAELRSVLYEVALRCTIGEFWTNGGDYEQELKDACKLCGIDLKAEEKKLTPKPTKAETGELFPAGKAAKKKGAKKK